MGVELATLIDALSRPEAYAHTADAFEVHQTHISVVFLAGPFAYKIRKPVNLGFLDFSTLEKRKHDCEEEVRLNRRLAPQVYLGVVPIAGTPLRFGGDGPIVEWAVQMTRLPAAATLEQRLERGEVTAKQIEALACRIADFHRGAETGPHIATFGRFEVVARNARENFTQAEPLVGATVSPVVFERLRQLTEEHLCRLRDLIEARAAGGMPHDTHGDLHLDHVYQFPEEAAPGDLVMIDCIEFADRYRYADPVADMAFLAMDLAYHGRRDLARVFADAYFTACGDCEGRALLPFYAAYRAVVRAKVEGMKLGEREVGAAERRRAEQRARAHWLLALTELETPARRPALVLLAGLPGTGKSTLARGLAERARFTVLRTDVVRKELAGEPDAPAREAAATLAGAAGSWGAGIYSEAWSERTYAEVLARAERLLWQGQRVAIDANFREERRRQPFHDAARRWGVPLVLVHCIVPPEVAHARILARHNDASDADWQIHERLRQTWQPIRAAWQHFTHVLDTSGTPAENELQLQTILRQEGLAPS